MNNTTFSKNEFHGAFPVIRLGYDKRLMNCNSTALPLMEQWNCRQGAKMPDHVLRNYPEIESAMKDTTPSHCILTLGELEIWCDIIPFPEAGYIGVYGYHIQSTVNETIPVEQTVNQ